MVQETIARFPSVEHPCSTQDGKTMRGKSSVAVAVSASVRATRSALVTASGRGNCVQGAVASGWSLPASLSAATGKRRTPTGCQAPEATPHAATSLALFRAPSTVKRLLEQTFAWSHVISEKSRS